MQIIENDKIKEKLYIEKLDNGLTIMVIPKSNTQKKYIIFGTKYGSVDNKFIVPGEENVTEVPNGIAHFLEHKMFEQENGTNSLDTLTSLGVSANAYTTNDHTAYLFESTSNFYEALDEFMDYIQHPYFTDENVKKEQGIIGQEIAMYDDYPEWKVYLNSMKAMYSINPVNIDITGTKESISKITKEILYKCYNTYYHPSNIAIVICRDFEPKEIIEQIQKRLVKKEEHEEIKRIYEKEPENIVQKEIEEKMEVSMPMFVIGYKDKKEENENIVKKHIAIEIILNILIGKSSTLYKELYKEGLLISEPTLEYEFSNTYAHVIITGNSINPKEVLKRLRKRIQEKIEQGIEQEEFERIKKTIYGDYVKEYNEIGDIARMFLADFFKGINSFEYIEECLRNKQNIRRTNLKTNF